MPRLGLTMEEGTVTAWPKQPGERVEKGEIVLVIETEKSEAEIEATHSGWLRHLYAAVGDTLPSGALLAALTETPDEPFDGTAFAALHSSASQPAGAATAPQAAASDARQSLAAGGAARPPAPSYGGPPTSAVSTTSKEGRLVATPRARRLAGELGVDLAQICGSGPGGRVIDDDVRRSAAAPQLAAPLLAAPRQATAGARPSRPAGSARTGGPPADRAASVPGELVETADGVLVEVFDQGAGDTVVMLVPGFGSDLSVFAPQIDALSRQHRVVGVHPRGTGRSTTPEQERYGPADGARDLLAVLERRGVARAHVVGASLGAVVALELALGAPDRIRSLVLVTPFLNASQRLLSVLDTWTELVRLGDLELAARAMGPWLFSEALLANEARSSLAMRGLARMMGHTPALALERWARGLATWPGLEAGRLAGLDARVLALHGGDDALVGGGGLAACALPNQRSHVIEGAGHALTLEAPAEVTRLILDHLHRS